MSFSLSTKAATSFLPMAPSRERRRGAAWLAYEAALMQGSRAHMITKLTLKNFKGFRDYEVPLSQLNLLVGGNNSGKTTIFHALQLFFWCLEKTSDVHGEEVVLSKTQVTSIGAVPVFSGRDLFFGQQQRQAKNAVRIQLTVETDATPPVTFEIYISFGRNLMIDGGDKRITKEEYGKLVKMRPVYIPGTIGITLQEEYLRAISQQRLIAEGRQNQVLRNLIFRLQKQGVWREFVGIVAPLFDLEGLEVPFDEEQDEWLSATYLEGSCEFDLVSAGSGFLQTLNLMCFLFLNESKTALLDEPDSHMHDDLQRVVFDVLKALSQKRNLQVIIATHSGTFVDAAGLDSVLLIDKKLSRPQQAQDVDSLLPLLSDQGLSLPPNKVLETLRTRKALFVEGLEADWEGFIAALGGVHEPSFNVRTRGLKVFETGGASKNWPFDAIDGFERLLGTGLDYLFVADRDFLTDEEISERKSVAAAGARKLMHLERRHRESYLLEPSVLARLLKAKWSETRGTEPLPDLLTEAGIRAFVLGKANELAIEAQTNLLVQHETKLRGDQAHRTAGTSELNRYFQETYAEPLGRGEIPYKLLDAKEVLRHFRSQVAKEYRLSFSDTDICQAYTRSDIPDDVQSILNGLLKMFPLRAATSTSSSSRFHPKEFPEEQATLL